MKHYKQDFENVWRRHFGAANIMRDCSGRKMNFDEYGNDSEFGWTIDHIKPIAAGGTDSIKNLIPMNRITNAEKGDSFPIFKANDKTLVIHKNTNQNTIKQFDWIIKEKK